MSPKLLPLINTRHGSRSAKTCEYRCANQCDAPTPNTSGNEEFQTLAQRAIARRAMLTGSAGAMVLAGFGAQAAAADTAHGHHPRPERNVGRASFTSVAPNRKDDVVNAEGFTHDVIIRWGDPVTKRAPRFDVHHQTPEAQAQQFGYNNDYVGIIPLDGRRALLSVNHEYTDPELMFPTGTDELLKKKIEMAAHGLAVVAIEKGRAKGSWKASDPRRSRYNRRITASTPLRVDGPAAGHELLRTKADPKGTTILGTFANCSGGTTPWGTTLHGEENFHGYFDASGALDPKQADAYKRYGITGQGKGWKDVDERFDLTKTPNEANRFGWIVELDPLDPSAPPVKHTMLGRVKHEGCNVTIARDGRVVAYTGDDEKGEKAKALGADHVVNYREERFEGEVRRLTRRKGVDVVFEHVGPDTWNGSLLCLKRGGRLVTCGSTSGVSTSMNLMQLFQQQYRITGSFGCSMANIRDAMAKMADGLTPVVDTVLPLADFAKGLERLESRKVFGKILVTL